MKDQAQLLARYQRLRHVGKHVNTALIERLTRDMLDEAGQKLGVIRGRTMALKQEHEIEVVCDFCVHDVRRQGMTAVERFLAETPPAPGSDERVVVEALQDARFSLFLVEGREEGVGVHVRDLLSDTAHFVVDRNFSMTAETDLVIAFRLMAPDGIDQTTGVALPVCMLPRDKRDATLHDVVTILGGPLSRARWSPEKRSEATATILSGLLGVNRSSSIRFADSEDVPRGTRPSGKPSVGRYDPCPCGSGKKFKFCCGARR
jgi:hypothetical protein